MPFCPTDICETCGCCMEVSCSPQFGGCHTENGEDDPRDSPDGIHDEFREATAERPT